MRYFENPKVKQWGWVLFFGLACFAAGNSFKTADALEGQGRWYQGYCHQQVVKHVTLQKRIDGAE